MSLFDRLFRRETPLDILKRQAELYDPRGKETDTLQGAMANAVLCLRNEANRNGWLNGGEFHAECIDMIKRHLCDEAAGKPFQEPSKLAALLEVIRDAALGGALEGRFAYEEVDQLQIDIANWCRANPKPIYRKPSQDAW
jgi:hypothetical protein